MGVSSKFAKKHKKGASLPSKPITNPFDAFGNKQAKFQVLNRRVKGQVRNVGKARQLAVERRKKTLLVEYKASKKDNVFKDRRFGEDDPSLSLEEKMLMRFQKERQKRARKSAAGRFNLENDDDDDDDEHGGLLLTHRGRALGEDDYKDQDLASSDDEDDQKGLNQQIVKELHFGGGAAGGRKRLLSGAEVDGPEGKKTRAEMMEEIIAKSKLHKAMKARQKDAQESTLSKLDEQFQYLVGDLEFREKYADKKKGKEEAVMISSLEAAKQGREKGGKEKGPLLLDEGKDYEELMALMRDERFAAKAKDRTKTEEEVAREEKEKLEKLEEARIARMKGELEGEIEEEKGGGSEWDEEEDDEEDDGPANGLEPLEGVWDDDDAGDSEGDSSDDDSEEEEEEEESGSESDEEEDDGGSDGEEEEKEEEVGKAKSKEKAKEGKRSKKEKKVKTEEEEEEEEVAAAVGGRPIGRIGRQKAALEQELTQIQTGALGINPEMPYVLDCPTTMEQFVDMMKEYAKGPQDAREMIGRIKKYHAIRSGGNRERVHNFYDVLMRRMIRLGDHLGSGVVDRRIEMEAVAEALVEMTKEMSTVAAGLWGRMLGGMHNRLEKALRDHELGQGGSTWPTPGSFLLLRLLPQIFPVTDFRHPVITPALLLVGQALAQCPVVSTIDLEAGLFCATLALHCTEAAGRLVPESVAFLLSILCALGGTEEGRPLPLPTFSPAFVAKLRAGFGAWVEGKGEEAGPIIVKGRRGSKDDKEGEEEKEKDDDEGLAYASLAGRVLAAVCHLIDRAVGGQWGISEAAPEILGPFSEALARLSKVATKGKKKRGSGLIGQTKKMVDEAIGEGKKRRTPLMWRKKEIQAIKSLAPRIIDNFVVRKDEGVDREAAKIKQLARQVKREKKGAMRELRRDAAFLDAEKVRAATEKEMERKRVVRENTAWLQEQQASINQQVKKTKGEVLRGGGSGIKKGMLKLHR